MRPLKVYEVVGVNVLRGGAYGYLGFSLFDLGTKLFAQQGDRLPHKEECHHQVGWILGLSVLMIFGSLVNFLGAIALCKIFKMNEEVSARFQQIINRSDFCFSISVLLFSIVMLIGFNTQCGIFSELIYSYLLFFWSPIVLCCTLIGFYLLVKSECFPVILSVSYYSQIELTQPFGELYQL